MSCGQSSIKAFCKSLLGKKGKFIVLRLRLINKYAVVRGFVSSLTVVLSSFFF